jgi:SAM-dependent methyltransferase
MGFWIIWVILGIMGIFFIFKVIYIITTALSIKKTKGATFTSTHPLKIRAILDAIPMKRGDVVIDLGCGDGRFLLAAAKRYGVRGIGYEINILAYILANLRRVFTGEQIEIKRINFWDASLKNADFVFCYLFPDLMPDLAKKAEKEMKEGSIIISCNFPLPGWEPEKVLRTNHRIHNDPIFIYSKNLKSRSSIIMSSQDPLTGSKG